ncbi:MAG: LemA family protein [Elusimicrobiaceae bacterium]|nr:LemA family protein [Elusimicrobiaceae bacterium]
MWIWFLVGFACAFMLMMVACYFKFSALHKAVQRTQRKLDAHLHKRRDLVPALSLTAATLPQLGTSFSYAFGQLPERCAAADSLTKQVACEAELSKALHELFAAAADHPPLQQDAYFRHLYEELIRTENRIQNAKKRYNSAVRDFNTLAAVFPLNLIAGMLDFKSFEYFDFDKSL